MHAITLYSNTLEGFAGRLAAVRPDQWNEATPCTEWTVRDLVNHVVANTRLVAPMLAGTNGAEVIGQPADLLGNDPVGALL